MQTSTNGSPFSADRVDLINDVVIAELHRLIWPSLPVRMWGKVQMSALHCCFKGNKALTR
jgi:hypothetical protein